MKTILFLALAALPAAPAAAQQQGQTVHVDATVDNMHHVQCPPAYSNIPCPTCPTGVKNLCGDVPGIVPGNLGAKRIDHQTCSSDGHAAGERFAARLRSLSTWSQKLGAAVTNEKAIASYMRQQASPYAGTYQANADALSNAAGFVDFTIQQSLQPLADKVKGAYSCLSAVQEGDDGCYHAFCSDLDGLDDDLGNKLPQALQTITDGVSGARPPADAGLPTVLFDQAHHNVCTDPQVPCYQQMDGAVVRFAQAAKATQDAALK